LATPVFTVETWFKRTGAGIATRTGAGGLDNVVPLVAKGRAEADGSNVDMNYLLGIDSVTGRLVADFEEGAAGASPGLNHPVSGQTVVTSGVWHHAAATYDGTTWRLYLDGAADGSSVVGQPARGDSVQHASLGTAMNSTGAADGFFAGVLDEVRIWSVARSGTQIAAARDQEITSASGLIGRWGFSEGAGTLARATAGSVDGQLVKGAGWGAGFVPPAAGPDVALVSPADGSTGHSAPVSIGIRVTDPAGRPMSVTFYARPSASGVYASIGTRSAVASGAQATVSWPSPSDGQRFEWYAVADNGSTSTTSPVWTFRTRPGPDPVIVGAGDIAKCELTGDEATGAVLQGVDGIVFTTGDNVYPDGTAADFANCYDPSWGPVRDRTRPVPGNHEWNTGSLAGYNAYFGAAATDAGGKSWYSYDISDRWHAIVLDTECDRVGGCGPGSPQETWLRADLAAHATDNVVVMWHKPRFSSAFNSDPALQTFVEDLYAAGVDLLLVGHDHVYERFAPLNPSGQVDSARGIPMFTLGTGGAAHHDFVSVRTGSLVRNNDTYGVVKFTLHEDSIDWRFLPEDGKTFTDSGSIATRTTQPANSTPVMQSVSIAPSAPRTVEVVTASATASDADGDTLTFAYQWTRNGADIAGATSRTLDLAGSGAGDRGDSVGVRVSASDGRATSTPLAASPVTVADSPPSVSAPPAQTTQVGDTVGLTVSGSDPDGDPLTFGATGLPAGLTISPAGVVSGSPTSPAVGTHTVQVNATDGELSSSASFTWTVTAADSGPAAPTALVAPVSSVAVDLDWADSPGPGLAGYRVYRGTTPSGTYTLLTSPPLTASSFSDTSAPLGVTSYYRVSVVDTGGGESAFATVQATRRIALVGQAAAARARTRDVSVSPPSGTTAGDLLVAAVTIRGSEQPKPPAGWAVVRSDVRSAAVRQTVYVRRVAAGEPGSHTWSVSNRTGMSVVVLAYRGAGATPLGSSGATVAAGTSVTAPSVNGAVAGSLVIGFYGVADSASLAPPVTLAERAQVMAPDRKDGVATMAADQVQASAGATGSRTAQADASAAAVGQLVVLAPTP
jgi:hypothetical protein